MSTRNNARHVRQRKLNTKQGLRIIRESEVEDVQDDESQRNIPQVETGVEKGEEVEFHLQAVISAANAAALGAKAKQNYIPTPETVKAKDVKYDDIYPEAFSQPATYIRFGATVEDSIGVSYCMNDDDLDFLARLNDGKDVDGRDRKDKLSQCSEDTFEEVMNFFEDASARIQPFASVDNAPIVSLDEMDQSVDDSVSIEARKWFKPIYKYWVLRKDNRPLMPSIKVRVLDTSSEADDADPYVCFRRREVRQTRKTRGRDAQVVEKLKKLRLELEQARNLVLTVVQREQLNKENLEISRKVFDERRRLKEVKITKNIIGEKGDDEDLLVNQKPVTKPKARSDLSSQQRPSTIRIRSIGGQSAPDTDLEMLSERQAEAEAYVNSSIETRKEQHKKWNHHWVDNTWVPLTPPPEEIEPEPRWATLSSVDFAYPTPPPSLPSVSRVASEAKDGDVEMHDQPPAEDKDATGGADREGNLDVDFNIFHIPGAWPVSDDEYEGVKRDAFPACRIRYGRGGRRFLESRKRKPTGQLSRGVVSDSDSDDDDIPDYHPIPDKITFEYRCALNNRARPDGAGGERRQYSNDQPGATQQQAVAGSSG